MNRFSKDCPLSEERSLLRRPQSQAAWRGGRFLATELKKQPLCAHPRRNLDACSVVVNGGDGLNATRPLAAKSGWTRRIVTGAWRSKTAPGSRIVIGPIVLAGAATHRNFVEHRASLWKEFGHFLAKLQGKNGTN